ncbi:MAG: HDIG domain-containing metalloprotein [Candidatus Bipolaricaulia bacterium]
MPKTKASRTGRAKERGGRGAHRALYLLLFAALLLGLLSFQPDRGSPWRYSFLDWGELLSNGLVALVLFTLLWFYLRHRQPELARQGRPIAFLGGLILTVLVLDKAANLFSPYLAPVALGVGLAVIFLGEEAGLLLSVALALLVSLGRGFYPMEGLVGLAGGLAMLLGVREIRRRGDLALAGIGVALINMLTLLAASASGFASLPWNAIIWTGVNGPISYLLLLGGIPVSEYLTHKTSPLGLMELLSPSHPLMERLQREAPGTYHHASNVAQLGANAARAIGADPLLAEVGGYYHDIGKLENPSYFAENQEGGENPHDELSPSMSRLILTAHVRKGIELGQRYGLREDVLRFIPEHHGTSVIRYFYVKALQEHKDEEISIDDYRYDAQLPRTKETAIIMLADSVEAAARVAESERLEEVIEEQIRAKLDDGQLDESPLTIADLHKVKKAFYETLRAMHHGRPEDYPRSSET